jgi:hypothetical protein
MQPKPHNTLWFGGGPDTSARRAEGGKGPEGAFPAPPGHDE